MRSRPKPPRRQRPTARRAAPCVIAPCTRGRSRRPSTVARLRTCRVRDDRLAPTRGPEARAEGGEGGAGIERRPARPIDGAASTTPVRGGEHSLALDGDGRARAHGATRAAVPAAARRAAAPRERASAQRRKRARRESARRRSCGEDRRVQRISRWADRAGRERLERRPTRRRTEAGERSWGDDRMPATASASAAPPAARAGRGRRCRGRGRGRRPSVAQIGRVNLTGRKDQEGFEAAAAGTAATRFHRSTGAVAAARWTPPPPRPCRRSRAGARARSSSDSRRRGRRARCDFKFTLYTDGGAGAQSTTSRSSSPTWRSSARTRLFVAEAAYLAGAAVGQRNISQRDPRMVTRHGARRNSSAAAAEVVRRPRARWPMVLARLRTRASRRFRRPPPTRVAPHRLSTTWRGPTARRAVAGIVRGPRARGLVCRQGCTHASCKQDSCALRQRRRHEPSYDGRLVTVGLSGAPRRGVQVAPTSRGSLPRPRASFDPAPR